MGIIPIYAAEGVNVVESTYIKGDETKECLYSEDDENYLQITQIVPNSQSVKIETYIEDHKLLISGVIKEGTKVTLKVRNENEETEEVSEERYRLVSTGTFTQPIEIKEGKNEILVFYSNEEDAIDNYIMFEVIQASKASMIAIKDYLVMG